MRSTGRDGVTGSMTEVTTDAAMDTPAWVTVRTADDVHLLCRDQHEVGIHGRPASVSLSERGVSMGAVRISEMVYGSPAWIDCGQQRATYNVIVPLRGRMDSTHRGSSIVTGPGGAAVFQPHGSASVREWTAGSRRVALQIDRHAVEDALGVALGGRRGAPIDFAPSMSSSTGAVRSWIDMALELGKQLLVHPGMLRHPMVGLPFVDCLIRGLLVVVDHPQRAAVTSGADAPAPRVVRAAIDMIEAHAHLPLTVAAIAVHCHVSVRSLQYAFRRQMGVSPMAYLRDVRMRRAHRALLEADPSRDTVATIAYAWGFTNMGRFSAAHAARYGDSPVAALRRHDVGRASAQ